MKASSGKNKKPAIFGLLAALAAVLLVPAWALADTYPYFDVSNGGIFAGGGFNTTQQCNGFNPGKDAAYHSPDFSNLGSTAKDGGILAFGSSSAGSHSDLASQALGLIESSPAATPPLNFSTFTTNDDTLAFANDLSNSSASSYSTNFGGGLFSGGSTTSYCIADYYGKLSNGLSPSTTCNLQANSILTGLHLYTPATSGCANNNVLTINQTGAAAFPTSQNSTVLVNGSLYIANNITYAGYGQDNSTTPATKLAFVVRGNILIAPGVTSLNGLYIAQPISLSDQQSGFIWTCHDNNPANLALDMSTYIKPVCVPAPALTVNGAFIGEQIVLDRLTGATSNFSGSPAETFNFTNDMSLGGSFFSNGAAGNSYTVDNLVSLPPVF